MTDGAVDHDYDDGVRAGEDRLRDTQERYERRIGPGDVTIDLVTGQPVYVNSVVANSLAGHLEAEDFDLLDYKMHPYLPVSMADAVLECVFIPTNPNDLIHPDKSTKTYDFPRGRLARVAIEDVTGGLRPTEDLAAYTLRTLFDAIPSDYDEFDYLEDVARSTVGHDVVDEALARSDVVVDQ